MDAVTVAVSLSVDFDVWRALPIFLYFAFAEINADEVKIL